MANFNEFLNEGKSTFNFMVLSLELLHGFKECRNISKVRDNLRVVAIS